MQVLVQEKTVHYQQCSYFKGAAASYKFNCFFFPLRLNLSSFLDDLSQKMFFELSYFDLKLQKILILKKIIRKCIQIVNVLTASPKFMFSLICRVFFARMWLTSHGFYSEEDFITERNWYICYFFKAAFDNIKQCMPVFVLKLIKVRYNHKRKTVHLQV